MNYNQIKDELIEKLGNNCHCYNGKIRCFTKCDNILNNVRARIERFNGEADYFLVNFDFYPINNNANIKKYKNVDDFISDFISVDKAMQEIERVISD